jgi:hypothetical protein
MPIYRMASFLVSAFIDLLDNKLPLLINSCET